MIYRLNKSSLLLAEIGFVDPVFGENVFQKQVQWKKSVNFSQIARVSDCIIT